MSATTFAVCCGAIKSVGHIASRFHTARFLMGGREYRAIVQNPDEPSRWGKLARKGHSVVQFRDLLTQKYVAAAVDGKITQYGRGSKH